MGIISTELCKVFIRTTMKVVLAFLFICLIQLSLGEQQNPSSSEGDLSLQREAREAKRGCSKGGQKCRDSNGQKRHQEKAKDKEVKKQTKEPGAKRHQEKAKDKEVKKQTKDPGAKGHQEKAKDKTRGSS